MASLTFCVDINPAARIGSGVMLDHGTGVVIGAAIVIDEARERGFLPASTTPFPGGAVASLPPRERPISLV